MNSKGFTDSNRFNYNDNDSDELCGMIRTYHVCNETVNRREIKSGVGVTLEYIRRELLI